MGFIGQCRQGIAAGLRRALGACERDGADMVRSRAQLVAENALLRQQLLALRRRVTRPTVTRADRALLVLLAGRVRAWGQALPSSSLRPCCAGIA